MGAKSFTPEPLLDFLKKTESDYLYLVGDIIDGWKLKKRWYWPEIYNEIFDEIARKVHQGTRVMYFPGNHDEEVRIIPILRRIRFSRRMHLHIRNKYIHKTANNRRFLILHGDQFDRSILKGSISKFSDQIYEWILEFLDRDKPLEIAVDGKIKRFSLAKYIQKHSKYALQALNNLENALVKTAHMHLADGVIMGHTHMPVIKQIKGKVYANCGAWLKSGCSALVECEDGNLEILPWSLELETAEQPCLFEPKADFEVLIRPHDYVYRKATNKAVKSIQKMWAGPQKTFKSKHSLISQTLKTSMQTPAYEDL